MLLDDLNKANIDAFKARDKVKKDILSIVIGKCKNRIVEKRVTNEELTDEDVLKILEKTVKELEEEILAFTNAKGDYSEKITNLLKQKDVVSSYLPTKLTESEIKDIILGLEDKSLPSVMKYFKENYQGKCDMKLVNQVVRNI